MARKPCPNCNMSGNSPTPGKIPSLFSNHKPTACGCGDGFIDDSPVAEDSHGSAEWVAAKGESLQREPGDLLGLPTQTERVLAAVDVTRKKERAKQALQKAKDICTSRDDALIFSRSSDPKFPTGLDGVDELIGGGWPVGVSVVTNLTERMQLEVWQASSSLELLTPDGVVFRPWAGSSPLPPIPLPSVGGSFVQSIMLSTSDVVYVASAGFLHELSSALAKAAQIHNKAVVLLVTRSVVPNVVRRAANIVLQREDAVDQYKVVKSRYSKPGTSTPEYVEPIRCISLQDFKNLVPGDRFSCAMWISPGAHGVKYDTDPACRHTFICTGKSTVNDITITITGATGTGKSALVDLIGHALATQGIDADVRGEDRDAAAMQNTRANVSKLQQKLKYIKERGVNVVIEHKNAARRPS